MGKYEETIDRQIRYQDELIWLMSEEVKKIDDNPR